MSKIYEALLNAQEEPEELEKLEGLETTGSDLMTRSAVAHLPVVVEMNLEREMVMLYQNIEALLPGVDRKALQFIGAKTGEGTSSIVREFARVAANLLGKSVFLLDAGQLKPRRCIFMHITAECGWQEVTPSGDILRDIAQGREVNLEIFPGSRCPDVETPNFYSPRISDFWDSLKKRYDMVLIDSPPAAVSPDGIEISRRVDGVVLVVEAEKTRWQVVENLKGKIAGCGGNILGVVFNKRRYYIPEKVYRWI